MNVIKNNLCRYTEARRREMSDEAPRGKAVQVDPITTKLKAPEAMRLKLKCDGSLWNFAFKFKLRRYTAQTSRTTAPGPRQGLTLVHFSA
jgi:hypothetical protein